MALNEVISFEDHVTLILKESFLSVQEDILLLLGKQDLIYSS